MMYMPEKAMSPTTKLFRYLALAGNLSLLFWVIAWQMTLSPHPHLSNVTLAIAWAIPLLLPLPGILAGKPYTHAWANFVLMLYFLHALTILYVDGGERLLAVSYTHLRAHETYLDISYGVFCLKKKRGGGGGG
ncbi:DUF2069 domain-containing protein, partial [Vibrio splendidus]